MKRINKNKRGFSLVELIMVVAIIVILAGVMAINISAYVQRAKNASNEESEMRSSFIGVVSASESKLENYGFGGRSNASV